MKKQTKAYGLTEVRHRCRDWKGAHGSPRKGKIQNKIGSMNGLRWVWKEADQVGSEPYSNITRDASS